MTRGPSSIGSGRETASGIMLSGYALTPAETGPCEASVPIRDKNAVVDVQNAVFVPNRDRVLFRSVDPLTLGARVPRLANSGNAADPYSNQGGHPASVARVTEVEGEVVARHHDV